MDRSPPATWESCMTQRSPRLRCKRDRKTSVTPALSTRSAQAVCSSRQGQASTAATTRDLLGAMVSIYQDPEWTRKEESSGEDHYERSREDPSVTLRHYQKSIPASVRAAAVALESELIGETSQSIRTGFEQVRN